MISLPHARLALPRRGRHDVLPRGHDRSRRVTQFAVAALAAMGCSSHGNYLLLDEVQVIRLPQHFDLAGATMNEDGDVVAWSRGNPVLFVATRDRQLILELPFIFAPLTARILRDTKFVQAIDPSVGRIVTMDLDGRLRGESFLGSKGSSASFSSAIPLPEGWGLVARTSSGGAAVSLASADQGVREIISLRRSDFAEWLPDSTAPLMVNLRPGLNTGELLVSTTWMPFRTTLLTDAVARSRTFQPGVLSVLPDQRRVAGDSAQRMALVSLGTLALDHGYLQTIADLKSDLRVLVLYDTDGRVIRQSRLDVAIGMQYSIPARRLLLAAVRTNESQLIVYQWHWGDHPESGR